MQHVFQSREDERPALDPGRRCVNSLRAGRERWSVLTPRLTETVAGWGRVTGSLFGGVCGVRRAAEVLRPRLTLKQVIHSIQRGIQGEGEMRALCTELATSVSGELFPNKFSLRLINSDFPGGPVSQTSCSQCRGPRFDPWSGN